ncbi:MAG: SET domain-containing protein [Candidatus Microsaccharimonas sp.]
MQSPESLFILKPSERDTTGVGCFALRMVEAGTRLYIPGDKSVNRRLSADEIPEGFLKYCPLLETGEFLAPENFASMSMFWYINHDRQPNIVADKWKLFAARDIQPGEEITLYYPDLLTHPMNKLWVDPAIHV